MPWVLLRGITHSAGHRIHLNASSPHTHRLPVNPYPHSTLIATALLPDLASQLFSRELAEIFSSPFFMLWVSSPRSASALPTHPLTHLHSLVAAPLIPLSPTLRARSIRKHPRKSDQWEAALASEPSVVSSTNVPFSFTTVCEALMMGSEPKVTESTQNQNKYVSWAKETHPKNFTAQCHCAGQLTKALQESENESIWCRRNTWAPGPWLQWAKSPTGMQKPLGRTYAP